MVERDRVTVPFDAVLASVKLNPLKYSEFLGILEIEGLDAIVVFIDGKSSILDLSFEDNQLVYCSYCSLIFTVRLQVVNSMQVYIQAAGPKFFSTLL